MSTPLDLRFVQIFFCPFTFKIIQFSLRFYFIHIPVLGLREKRESNLTTFTI